MTEPEAKEPVAMLPLVGLVALLLYLVLWQTGWLQDLSTWAAARQARGKKKRGAAPSERARLDVFEEFIERLDDDKESPRSKTPPD
jgi:hypothetical protein